MGQGCLWARGAYGPGGPMGQEAYEPRGARGGRTDGWMDGRTDVLTYTSWCRGQRPLSGPLPKRKRSSNLFAIPASLNGHFVLSLLNGLPVLTQPKGWPLPSLPKEQSNAQTSLRGVPSQSRQTSLSQACQMGDLAQANKPSKVVACPRPAQGVVFPKIIPRVTCDRPPVG